MAKRPLIFDPRGGHETLAKQRPMDGDFTVGPGSIESPSPPCSCHPVNPHCVTASNGAPSVPSQQQPKYGSASVGLGPSGQQPPFISHLSEVRFLHPGGSTFAGLHLPSFDEVPSRCTKVINQGYVQYQQAFLAAATPSKSAMAAAPSSNCSTSQQAKQPFEVRSTVLLKQKPSRSTETNNVYGDSSLNVRNRTECGQGVRQEGSKTFRNIYKGRKRNTKAIAKRRTRDVEPLETQARLEPTVGKGTSIVNGKQFGSLSPPPAVCSSTASGSTQWLTDKSSCDVFISSEKHRKIIHSTEGPGHHTGSDGVDNNGRCHNADSSTSAKMQKSLSANVNNLRLTSWSIDAVDQQLDRSEQTPAVISVCVPPAVVAHVSIGVTKKIESRREDYLILSQHLCSFPHAKSVDIKAHQLFIIHHGRWLFSSGVVAFIDRPPPWPPPSQDLPARTSSTSTISTTSSSTESAVASKQPWCSLRDRRPPCGSTVTSLLGGRCWDNWTWDLGTLQSAPDLYRWAHH